jgi:hypothetical protein
MKEYGMGGVRSMHKEIRKMHTKFCSEKPKGKRHLARSRRKWDDNIKDGS